MRRFVTQEKLAMIDAQKKLMQARDTMDAARHAVRFLQILHSFTDIWYGVEKINI